MRASEGKPGPSIVWSVFRVLVAAVAVFLLDQTTKHWVVAHVQPGPWNAMNIIDDWFQILYTQNSGLILGLGRGSPLFVNLVILVATFILLAYAFSEVRRGTNSMALVGVGMIFGGAAGNLTDRIRLDYVVDFIAIGRWPVFNFADASIVTGVLILILSYYLEEQAALKAAAVRAEEEARLAELPSNPEGTVETSELETPSEATGTEPSASESPAGAPADPDPAAPAETPAPPPDSTLKHP